MAVGADALRVDTVALGVGAHPAHGALGVVELVGPDVGAGRVARQAVLDVEGDVAGRRQVGRGSGHVDPAADPERPGAAVEQEHGRARRIAIRRSGDIEQQFLAIDLAVDDIALYRDGRCARSGVFGPKVAGRSRQWPRPRPQAPRPARAVRRDTAATDP